MQSLACSISYICKKTKEQKLKERSLELFEDQLDVRSFVSVKKNLTLLIWLLLSKE